MFAKIKEWLLLKKENENLNTQLNVAILFNKILQNDNDDLKAKYNKLEAEVISCLCAIAIRHGGSYTVSNDFFEMSANEKISIAYNDNKDMTITVLGTEHNDKQE